MAKSTNKKTLSTQERDAILAILSSRFEKNKQRHPGIPWKAVEQALLKKPTALWTLSIMEETGGEPDVIAFDKKTGTYHFCDCAPETPKGRRSICYDEAALESRKEHKPADSAMGMAKEMGVEMLDETQYRYLQTLGKFDQKTSSWLKTPANIRKLGGAIFGDCRFDTVWIYHNGAESYYGARSFRGLLIV